MRYLMTILLLASSFGFSQSTASDNSAQAGRFVLTSATVTGSDDVGTDKTQHVLFLIDTKTGKVWSYLPSSTPRQKDGSVRVIPEGFIQVFVDGVDGKYFDFMQKTLGQSFPVVR